MGAVRKFAGLDQDLVERAADAGVSLAGKSEETIRAEVEAWERATLPDRMRRQMELWNEWEKGKLLPSDDFGLY